MKINHLILAALCTSVPALAIADDASSPSVSADLVLEWRHNYHADSQDPAIDNQHRSFMYGELSPTVRINENFFVDGTLVFEPMDQFESLHAGEDAWFDRHGGFAEEIKLNYENGPWAAYIGKIHPDFGIAWDYGRGIWSEDFAADYELAEVLGFGGAYTFETANAGNHTLGFSSFFVDTSFLSRSIITSRGKARLSDGGAGNTEDLSSYTISLNGEDAGGIENLGYHIAYEHLGEQDSGRSAATDDQNGVAINLSYVAPVNENISVDLLTEFVGISSAAGIKNFDVNYYSASAVATFYENWLLTLGYTLRDIRNDGAGNGYDDNLFQLTGGYDFGNGLTAEGGWRTADEVGVQTDTLGFLFRYSRSM